MEYFAFLPEFKRVRVHRLKYLKNAHFTENSKFYNLNKFDSKVLGEIYS